MRHPFGLVEQVVLLYTKLSPYQRRMQVVGLLVFTYFTGLQGVPKFPDPDCRTDDGHSGRMLGSGVMLSQIRICSLPTLNPRCERP